MSTLFVSDLHLDTARPQATAAFLRFLNDEAPAARTLYILGDLFESCSGNDPLDPLQESLAAALANLASQGTRSFFMYGNRDFLLADEFLRRSHLTLLPDPTLIYVGGESVLVSHGDIYCTDDVAYQRYRRVVRNPLVRAVYDALPRGIRSRIVAGLRSNSEKTNLQKASEVMDVNQQAIQAALRDYRPATLLHGHTHRPGIHELELDDRQHRRIVLGDWYTQGSVLRWDTGGPQLTQLQL